MMDFKLFTILFKIIADVFSLWHIFNTHLKAPDQQTAKTSAFIEVLTLSDDRFNQRDLLSSA